MTHISSKTSPRPVGEVLRYIPRNHAALIRFHKDIPMYSHILIRGKRTHTDEVITSMEFEHVPIWIAEKEKDIQVSVHDPVQVGDKVFEI